MRVFILILTMFLVYSAASAEKPPVKNDWGENASAFNKGFENQQPVTDTKLHKTIEMIKERSLTKKQKKLQDKITPLGPSFDNEHLKEFTLSQDADNDLNNALTVMIPVQAYSDDGTVIPPGYYKLSCRKAGENSYVLELSQGTKKILEVNANQTTQDLEQDTITFCNAEIIENNRIRLIYGSINLNLVAYLYFD